MFTDITSFSVSARTKRAPMLADFLRFNLRTGTHYDLGSAGEKLAAAMFEDAGYRARKPQNYHGVDLEIVDRETGEIFTVEVKTSAYSEKSKNWQFCLNKGKHTSIAHSAYVLFILIENKRIFTYLIPTEFLGKAKQFKIGTHPEKYKGKAAPFRQRQLLSFQAARNAYELAMLQ